jgi:hypothetical protein
MVEQTLNQMLGLREAVVAISQQNQQLYPMKAKKRRQRLMVLFQRLNLRSTRV